jgi:hypothetical protein
MRKFKRNLSPPIPVVIAEYPDLTEIKILPLGDPHWDAFSTKKELFAKKIKQCIDSNTQIIIMGDMVDKLFFNSLIRNEQDATLNETLEVLSRILEPAKEQILCLVEGNHDRGIEKRTGFSIIDAIALRIEAPVIRGQGIVHIRVGNSNGTTHSKNKRMYSYAGLVTHGWGGGRTAGGKINKVLGLSNFWHDLDFFIMGHVHDSKNIPKKIFWYDKRNESISSKHVRHIITSSFLDYPVYAQQRGYPPGATMEYTMHLSGIKNDIWIDEHEMEE